ncbi:hypothetical protein PP175_10700 [Aneurinibacillus sp. Ricciae_BoGa-3]|uniref:hypothetical protein n=1 Tax=Aneurinibacillus sp. Ricciae_BoGa-3 TaxID=3022697 RepID=UPI00233FC432|nr:hypothetical protein [Aneurinibacillus sp. Ricciae_BoGa-3]WCK56337.1 hypothetical protein PP175_10700 [Aneurinibacillus sp. Ricciae_BoGa-3]
MIQRMWSGPVRRRRAHRLQHLEMLYRQKRNHEKSLATLYETIPQIPNLRIRKKFSDEAESLVGIIETLDKEIKLLETKWK